MARIRINDLPKGMKISGHELTAIRGGSVLSDLVDVLAEQTAILRREQDRLWKDQFIESSDSWAVPDIGDRMGTRKVSGARRRY